MTFERPGLDELREEVLQGRLDRRTVLRRSLALGLSAPVIASLLAACGDDDDDDDDTGQTEDPTPTEAVEEEPTEEAEEEPTEEATEEEEPTEGATEEEEPTEEGTEEEEEPAEGEQTFEGGDRLMGKDIEEAGSEGGISLRAASPTLPR